MGRYGLVQDRYESAGSRLRTDSGQDLRRSRRRTGAEELSAGYGMYGSRAPRTRNTSGESGRPNRAYDDRYDDRYGRSSSARRTQDPGSRRSYAGQKQARAARPAREERYPASRGGRNTRQGAVRRPSRAGQMSRKKRRRRQRMQQAIMGRVFVLCFLGLVVFAAFHGVAAMLNFIEGSRESQRGEVETVAQTSGLDLAEATEAMTVEETAGSAESAESAAEETLQQDGNLVFSGGRYVDLTKPMVALTFDDGPESKVGNVLMDELEKVDGRGTFFIVGSRVAEFQEEVLRMVADGHEVANHSWDHDIHLSRNSEDYIRQEFSKTDDAIREVAGIETALIRLPGGNVSDTVRAVVTKPMIYWSIDTEDWKTRDAQSTIDSILPHIKDGDVVLMHELYTATAEACKVVIPELAARGFQMVTVSELIQFHGAEVEGGNGKQYEWFPPKETEAESETAAETSESETAAAIAEASDTGDAADAGTTAESGTMIGSETE